jgi:ribose transport system permease protein
MSWSRLRRDTPIVQLLVLAALFAIGMVTLDGFTQTSALRSMLLLASFLGLATVGQTLVMLLGSIDLSIPGFIALGNVLVAVLMGSHHWPAVAAFAVIFASSVVLGGLSGYLCHRFGVQSIVVTLGMSFVVLGGISLITVGGVSGSAPAWLSRFTSASSSTFGIGLPPIVVLWAVIAVVVGVVLRWTVIGRRVYLTGANPVAARLALVKTGRIVTASFALSAASAALTGALLAGFSGAADASIGTPYLFTSLTAVIVGGTSMVGGRGDYWRTVIGTLILTVLTTLLLGHGYELYDQQILLGVLILVVVFAYGRQPRLRDRV